MANNKIVLRSGETLIDLTEDTVDKAILVKGYTAHNAAGEQILGEFGSVVSEVTLSASNWVGTTAPYTYTISISGVTATSNQEILPSVSITAEQLEALQAANIQDGGQSVGKIVLKAFGDKPSIDLPVRIILRGVF